MKITSALNPQWADEAQTIINLTVDFEGLGNVPFTASPNDSESHGRDIFARAVAGEFGVIAPLPAKPLATLKAEKVAQIEQSRDAATNLDVTALGTQWQADERSQKLLSAAITLATVGAPLPDVWRDAHNNNMTITNISQLVEIAGAMAVQTQAAYAKSWVLKGQVAAATTEAEVAAVTW